MHKHPTGAWVYIWGLVLAALALSWPWGGKPVPSPGQWWLAGSLLILLCLSHLLPVFTPGRTVIYEISSVFELAVLLLLPLHMASAAIALAWLPYLAVANRSQRWLHPLFNWAQIIVGGWLVVATMALVPSVAALYLAGPLFVVFNTFLVVTLVALDRQVPWHRTEVVNLNNLVSDLGLACLGVVLAQLIREAPAMAPLTLVPLAALYRVNQQFQMIHLGLLDPKTLVYNSRYFERTLTAQLARSLRNQKPVSVIFGDMDYLRHVNNNYGHLTGDRVIDQIAKILQQNARREDVVARFGGEEFVVMLPGLTKAEAGVLADQMRTAIAAHPFHSPDGKVFHVTMSMGVSCAPDDGTDAGALIETADTAAYRAKECGRNRVVIA